jgi:hypothetical protein
MLRAQLVRLLRPACLGLVLAACQAPEAYHQGDGMGLGQGGSTPTGTAGTNVTGAAGFVATGAAGTNATGAAGTNATGAAGTNATGAAGTNATGAAGTSATGAAGTIGAAGRGGTTGAAGRGGTTGAAGRGGTTGAAGRGGTTGSAGQAGTVGRGGTTGTAGTNGGANSCPLGGKLDCTTAGALDLTPSGQVVDFSSAQWNNTTKAWCNADGLDGGLFSFAGTGSMAAAAVDTTARNLTLNLEVTAGQYAGGGVNFDSCVDARDFNSIQFTASVTGGSLTGCVWQVQLQTQDQYPTTATDPTGGTCATNCRRYPLATLTAPTATAAMFTTRFTAFNNPGGSTVPTASQVIGVQWQVNSGNSGSGTCTVELRIDNIRFVTQ